MGKPSKPEFKMRLEYVGPNEKNISGRSSKFWECAVWRINGVARLVRRWGKIGTYGQTKRELHDDITAACREAVHLMKQKQKKGYTLEVEPDIVTLLAALEG